MKLGVGTTKIGSGATPRGGAKIYQTSGVALIRSQNVYNEGFRIEGLAFISDEEADRLDHVAVRPDDVLLNITGDSVARSCTVSPDVLPARVNQHVAIVRADPSRLSPSFLRYFMVAPTTQHLLLSLAGSGGTRNALTKAMIERLDIPDVDLDTQRSIGGTLKVLDDKIELNRRMNRTLEETARAIFKSWFVDFNPVRGTAAVPDEVRRLFPDRLVDSPIGPIPEGWTTGTLADIVDVIDCLHSKKPQRRETGLPLLQLWNIRDDGLLDMSDSYLIDEADYREWTRRMEAGPGDCVVTNVGRSGAVAQIPSGAAAALGRNMTGLRCKPSFPYPTLLIEMMLSHQMQGEIERNLDAGTVMASLNVRSIPSLPVTMPGNGVLAAFEAAVRPLRAKMEQGLQENRVLAELRDTLLPKLISGRVRLAGAA